MEEERREERKRTGGGELVPTVRRAEAPAIQIAQLKCKIPLQFEW